MTDSTAHSPDSRTDELLAAEGALQAAMRTGDVDTLDDLLRDDLHHTGPDGTVSGKAEDLDAYRRGTLIVTSLRPEDLRATVADASGVTSVLMHLTGLAGGHPFATTVRYTRMWTRAAGGRWQVLAAHACAVTAPAGNAGAGDAAGAGTDVTGAATGVAGTGTRVADARAGAGGTGNRAEANMPVVTTFGAGEHEPEEREPESHEKVRDHPRLVAGNVTVRTGGPADVAALTSILAQESVARWWGPPETPDEVLAKLASDEETVLLVIEVDGRVAGGIEYSEENYPQYRHAGIDIYLSDHTQGHGVGTTAVRLVARYLFEQRGHHRLTIDPAVDNLRAISCYEHAGFRPVGVLRQYERRADGEFHDGLLMDMLRGELVA